MHMGSGQPWWLTSSATGGDGYKYLTPENAYPYGRFLGERYRSKPELTQTWTAALHSPGAATLRHAKGFLLGIGWADFVPDASLILEGEGSGATRNVAMRHSHGDAVAVYLAAPAKVSLALDRIADTEGPLVGRWTNPATGEDLPTGPLERRPVSLSSPPGWTDALLLIATQAHMHP